MPFTALSASTLNTVLVAGAQQFAFGNVWVPSMSHSKQSYFYGSFGKFLDQMGSDVATRLRAQLTATGLNLEALSAYKVTWLWLDQVAIEEWVRETYPTTQWDGSLFDIARYHRPLRGAALLACGNRLEGYFAIESEHFHEIGITPAVFAPRISEAAISRTDVARAA